MSTSGLFVVVCVTREWCPLLYNCQLLTRGKGQGTVDICPVSPFCGLQITSQINIPDCGTNTATHYDKYSILVCAILHYLLADSTAIILCPPHPVPCHFKDEIMLVARIENSNRYNSSNMEVHINWKNMLYQYGDGRWLSIYFECAIYKLCETPFWHSTYSVTLPGTIVYYLCVFLYVLPHVDSCEM